MSKKELFNKQSIKLAKGLEKEVKKLNCRLHRIDDGGRNRNDYERDYARIIYSSSFRRLQGKMQLLGIDHTSFHRNRLTHSLEVAQIARTIASGLKLKSPVVSEACSLAHDIGNPPFGHSGEKTLNNLAKDIGGFEGNAQVIRILCRLERKYPDENGLNLTVRTLLGLTKYFYRRGENEKNKEKFLYDNDYVTLNEIKESKNVTNRRSIDLQIMDLSDEIAYAAHDLEDSLAMGYMSIDEILYEFKTSKDYSGAYDTFQEIIKDVQKDCSKSKNVKSSEEYSSIIRREITSRIVDKLVRDIEFNCEKLEFQEHALLSKGLKKLVFKSLLRKKNVQLYEKMGNKVISGLYNVYSDESFNEGGILLPVEYRNIDNDRDFKRSIIDYLAGMMDSFAIDEYKKYYGSRSLETLYSN